MTSTTTTEDKRMYIIWLSVVGMLAVAVLLGILLPDVFTFWMCAGVFLAGIGLIAGILLLFMGKRYVSFFSFFLVIAGIILILSGVFEIIGIYVHPLVMPAIAVLVIVIGLIIWLVLGNKKRETKW